MTEDATFLLVLQHGDSFFPSGSVSFSWGIEGLCEDGLIRTADDLRSFIEGQLLCRWQTCDLPALLSAHRAGGDLDQVSAVDAAIEALTLPARLREGSRRCGAALLGVHEKLGTAGAASYRKRVREGCSPGHLSPIQGLVWSSLGVSERAAAALSAHTAVTGLLGAALRLGVVGHIDAQRILSEVQLTARKIIAKDISTEPDLLSSYGPATEIAIMRHETRDARLFFN